MDESDELVELNGIDLFLRFFSPPPDNDNSVQGSAAYSKHGLHAVEFYNDFLTSQ